MTTATPALSDILTNRLTNLRAERNEVMGELLVSNTGDTADRATNVDANARLSLIEQRIAAVEIEMQNRRSPKTANAGTGVAVGDVVTVDLGDGPETYLLAGLEQAGGDLDVISPASPLGRAILGAAVGATVTYRSGAKREFSATVVAVS